MKTMLLYIKKAYLFITIIHHCYSMNSCYIAYVSMYIVIFTAVFVYLIV